MALSLPHSAPCPSSPHPFSPLSPSLMSMLGSQRQWQGVRCFHVRGSWGMSVTASGEPGWSGNKIMEGDMRDMDIRYTHTHTHFFKHISIMYTSHCCHFLEQSRILSSLRWVKFNIKLKHVWNLFEVLQKYVSAAQIASVHYFQDEQEPRCFLITFIYYQVL